MNTKILIVVGIIIVVIIGVSLLSMNQEPPGPGEYDDFARCLTEKGTIMYGTDRCHACTDQKEIFGSSFQHIKYVNCDVDPELCDTEGVEAYPTWKYNTRIYGGKRDLNFLSSLTSCEI